MTRFARRGLLVCEYFPPAVGGAARWAGDLVDRAETIRWTVLTPPVEGAPAREARGAHWIVRPPWWVVPPSVLSWRTALAARRLAREIDRFLAEGVSVVHALPPQISGLAALGPCRRRGVPLVVHVLGEEMTMLGRRPTRRWIFRRVLSRAAAVLANSGPTAERAAAFGAPPDRLRVLHDAVDTDRFRPPAGEAGRLAARRRWKIDGRRALLTVGRLVERKGIDRTIEAVARLAREDPALVYLVAGTGPDRPRLEGLARAAGVADRVRFLGFVAEEDLPALYGAADLFVMPNREIPSTGEVEGLGLVFLEAAACGVPSVAGRSGGAPDAVVDGETGLVVDPNDVGAIAAAIRLMLDPDRRARCGAAARARVERAFSWRVILPRLEALGASRQG